VVGKALKSVSIAALLASFLWSFFAKGQVWSVQTGGYLEVLALIVWVTALMVVAQTALARRYFWAVGFVAIAALFNPIIPIRLSRPVFLTLDSFCTLAFVFAVTVLKAGRKRDWGMVSPSLL
jgi:hypothetical protein